MHLHYKQILTNCHHGETTWKMAFHTDTCNVISSVARNLKKKKPITFKYPLNNHSLEHVTTSKISGVNHQLKP